MYIHTYFYIWIDAKGCILMWVGQSFRVATETKLEDVYFQSFGTVYKELDSLKTCPKIQLNWLSCVVFSIIISFNNLFASSDCVLH